MLTKQDIQIFKVAAKSKRQTAITGVRISAIERHGRHAIRLVATDGVHLTEKTVDVDYVPTFDEMVVPAKTLEDVAKILNKYRRVLISDNQFKIMNIKDDPEGVLERTITIGSKISSDFPSHDHLNPDGEATVAIEVNPALLINALKQCHDNRVIVELYAANKAVVLKDGQDYRTTLSFVMPLQTEDNDAQ